MAAGDKTAHKAWCCGHATKALCTALGSVITLTSDPLHSQPPHPLRRPRTSSRNLP